jgi:hypothetical protein
MVDERQAGTAGEPELGLADPELLKFSLIRNAAYHDDREHFYALAHRLLMFLVVAVGTLSAGASMAAENRLATYGTLFAVLAGLIDIVWNVDGLAREHSTLRRRSYDLLARLEAGEPINVLRAEYVRILADEPPTMHAVNALAFNMAVDAMGRTKEQKYSLQLWQRLFRHLWPFRPSEFPTVGDTAQARS